MEAILEVIQLFPPERVSERIVVQIVDVPVPQIPTRVEPFIHPEAWDPLMESFTAEFVVQRTALAGSSSSSHSEARNAFFGFSHLFAELGVPGQRGKSMGQACGAHRTGRSLPFTRSVRGTAVC